MAYDTTRNGEWTQEDSKGLQRQIKATQEAQRQTKHSNTQRLPTEVSINTQRKHKKFPPIMWLTWYVNSIDKEINSG